MTLLTCKIRNKIQALSSYFVWTYKYMDHHFLTPIAWDKVTLPRTLGGRSIRNLSIQLIWLLIVLDMEE